MPRHVNPTNNERSATAPYNFVPLPERVFDVADGIDVGGERIKPWEMHDQFVPGTHSGCIDLTIETLTLLFIRGAVRQREDGSWDGRGSRLRPEPYVTPDGRPAIPGSSLRGMVRTLVEILSFSKIRPVTKAKPFFRDISPSRISTEYRRHFIEDLGELTSGTDIGGGQALSRRAPGYRARVRAGLLSLGDRTIRERRFARIEQTLIGSTFNTSSLSGSGPMATPSWGLQHSRIWVRADASEQDYFFCRKTTPNGRQRHPDLYLRFRKVHSASRSESPGHQSGVLVITGGIPNKHLEFVFLDPGAGAALPIEIPDAVWDRFHDDDQITQWQERAFPTDRPTTQCRSSKGHLRDGEPVFFLTDNNGDLVFLGRAQMFRFPYDLSPEDLVPDAIRSGPLDLAEAMFGNVDGDQAIKGRVHFEDAVATAGGPPWCEAILVPRILSSPKPTTFQHYLTQEGTKGKDQLTTYIDGDHTTIRGHKLYWHRDDGSGVSQIREGDNHDSLLLQDLRRPNPQNTQHTIIQPVKKGVTFAARVRFENLSGVELGALLHALQLPDGCAHRLGMGKPLGLGSIRITARLNVIDREARYRTWQASGIEGDEDCGPFREAFEGAILDHAQRSRETMLRQRDGLRRIARLDTLFCLLEWTNRPASTATAYMGLARFRDRPVLPTPHRVAGAGEPGWPGDPPRPGSGGGAGRGSSERRTERTEVRQAARPARPQPRPVAPKPIQKGQTRLGTLKRVGAGWVAVFDGDPREAQVLNPHSIDSSCTDGAAAEFYIVEQSKSAGIKCRFERMR